MKFGRTYRLRIEDQKGQVLTIPYPLTLVFKVNRTTLASASTGTFFLYNLKEDTRSRLFKDRNDTDLANFRHIVLEAGYESDKTLSIIFQGNIRWTYSRKQGIEWVTEIEAFDGGDAIINSQASLTRPKDYDLKNVIIDMLKTLSTYKVGVGAVGNFSVDSSRGLSLSGNTWDIISNRLIGNTGEAFIDLERANVLHRNEYIVKPGLLQEVSSSTGLIGTPRRYNERLEVVMVFEPNLIVDQLIKLRSQEAVYNGDYIVKGIAHEGTISGAVNGQVTTTMSLWKGTELLGVPSK